MERVPTHPLILSILSKPPVAGDRINGIIQNWEGSWPQRRRDTEGKKPERKFETRYLVSYEGKTSGQGWDAVERVPTESRLASVLLGEVTRHRVSTFQTQAAKVGRGGGISLYNEASGLVKEELS